MFRNYLHVAVKNLFKFAGVSFTNLIGLSIGLAVCGWITLFVQHELSYDRSNPAADRIYRLNTTFRYPRSPERPTAMASIPMGPFLQRESRDVEDYLRVVTNNKDFLCRHGQRTATVEKSLAVDPSFFSFFNFPLLYGNRQEVFKEPGNIVITKEVSEKLFDDANPVGQVLDYVEPQGPGSADTTIHYMIAGVLAPLPDNTHLHFEALVPLDTRFYDRWNDSNRWTESNRWHATITNTYLRLRATADPRQVAATFPVLLQKEMPNPTMVSLGLQALPDIHLSSMDLEYDLNNFQKAERRYVYVLGLIALLILLIAGINFTNLSTVLAHRRMKEIAVRKSIGASRLDVIRQFLGESLLLASLAGVLALGWMYLLEKPFSQLMGRTMTGVSSSALWLGMVAAVFSVGFLAGIFPALRLARFSAAQGFQRNTTGVSLRHPFVRGLVIVQFTMSVVLIIGMLVCYRQLWFLRHADLGYSPAQIVQLDVGVSNFFKYPLLKEALKKIPGVLEVTGSSHALGKMDSQNGVLVRNAETRKWENDPMNIIRADRNYFELYGMHFVKGQAPGAGSEVKELEYVVNEAFVRKMGWSGDPIGREIMRAGLPEDEIGHIVGVVQDFHYNSLHHIIEPIVIQVSQATTVVSVQVATADLSNTLAQVGALWPQYISDRPFDYSFLDDNFAALYANEARLGQSLLAATGLAIFIACLGLLALSAFLIQQRTKEIGVRKVLGASISSVVTLLSKDFLQLVLISFLLAVPIAYYFAQRWLADFAYRIDLSWWMFALAGFAALLIAFLTVSLQSIRAALANPVQALRNE